MLSLFRPLLSLCRLPLSLFRFVFPSLLSARTISAVYVCLLFTACGGGSDNEPRYSISGTINITNSVHIDSDNNDLNASFESNNTISEAQELDSFAILSGFVAEKQTNTANQRFQNQADPSDVYKATLVQGQVITLTITNWNSFDPLVVDLDLTVFDSNGNQLAASAGSDKVETISINKNGTYYIAVEAFSGHSGYLLAIDQSNATVSSQDTTDGANSKFVLGQAIVKYRETISSKLTRKVLAAQGLKARTNQTDRATLVEFDPQTVSPQEIGTKIGLPRSLSTSSNSAKPVSAPESAFRSELEQIYPLIYKKLKTLDVIKSLNQRDDVEYAEPNYIRRPFLIPNDRGYESQWHYPLINLPKAWDITTGTPEKGKVIVAVIDTGILPNHPDLRNQLVKGYDFIRNTSQSNDSDGIDSDPTDTGDGEPDKNKPNSWHGSHVAGTIAAQTNNRTGVAGVSWGAKIMPLRALGIGGGTTYSVVQSIRFAAGLSNDSGTRPAQRADIINMSFGGPDFSTAEQVAINAAHNAGVILVAAAGNESTTASSYPASFPHVISVSSIGADGRFADSYSNSGRNIDLAAPGGNILQDFNDDGYADGVLSTVQDNRNGRPSYMFYEGTSMAAPHVSGVLALMKAVDPSLTPNDIESALIKGELTNDAGLRGRDNLYGHGIIDAFKAVSFAQKGVRPDVVLAASSSALQFASFQSSKVVDLSNLGRLGNLIQVQVSEIEKSAPWLTVMALPKKEGTLASYQFVVNRGALSLGVYETTVNFSFSNQGVELDETISVKVKVYVGTTSSLPDAGPLYILAREQSLELKEGEFYPETLSRAVNGEYHFQFDNLKPGRYIIHAGTDSDSNTIICNEHEACGLYPTISRPVAVELNQNISNLNFSVGISRPIDLNVSSNQKTEVQATEAQAVEEQGTELHNSNSYTVKRRNNKVETQGVNQ